MEVREIIGNTTATPSPLPESMHIRYSAYADGRDFVETWSYGLNYIGFATARKAPSEKEAYQWSLFASNIRSTTTVTLSADAWDNNRQTVSVSSIGDNSSVFCTAHPDSKDDYINYGIFLESATVDSLLFSCADTPITNIFVNIQVMEPLIGTEISPSVAESIENLSNKIDDLEADVAQKSAVQIFTWGADD